jgi:hypothetical protein
MTGKGEGLLPLALGDHGSDMVIRSARVRTQHHPLMSKFENCP